MELNDTAGYRKLLAEISEMYSQGRQRATQSLGSLCGDVFQ